MVWKRTLLFDVLWIILGFIVIVTAIYLPLIDTCNGWCCSSSSRKSEHVSGVYRLPYQPRESKQSLQKFTRQTGQKNSGQNSAVMILENFFSGLSTVSISHQPIFNIARLAAELRPESSNIVEGKFTYRHKNQFPLIALSGKKGSTEEIYTAAYLAQALAKPNATVVMNGVTADSSAFHAWSRLVHDGIMHWKTEDLYHKDGEHWVVGTYKDLQTKKCVSEYLHDRMSAYVNLGQNEGTDLPKTKTYYVISKEREEELRRAYEKDRHFTVTNLTTAFHAATLKIIYPKLNVTIDDKSLPALTPKVSVKEIEEDVETTRYRKALQFLETYILV